MLVHVRRDARRGLEMHKVKAADVGSLKQSSLGAGGAANSPSVVALRDAVPPENGVFVHHLSVAFHLPPV